MEYSIPRGGDARCQSAAAVDIGLRSLPLDNLEIGNAWTLLTHANKELPENSLGVKKDLYAVQIFPHPPGLFTSA